MKTLVMLLFAVCCGTLFGQEGQNASAGDSATPSTAEGNRTGVAAGSGTTRKPRSFTIQPYCGNCKTDSAGPARSYLVPGDYVRIRCHGDMTGAEGFRLWINGYCHEKNKPLAVNAGDSTLVFRLAPDTGKASPWRPFYTFENRLFYHSGRNIQIGLGSVSAPDFTCITKKLRLDTSKPWVVKVCYSLLLLTIGVILLFARRMIRDTHMIGDAYTISYREPTDLDSFVINIRDVPFSLARTQFLVWLLMIFFGVFHLWIVTDTLLSPTGNVLILLTISGTTLFISKKIDQPAAVATRPILSKGFVYDVLNDGLGISVHRLQLLVFTAFMAVYFIVDVTTKLRMPEFDTTMLTLMGISGGMYVGLKTTEQ
jgi:hypothetical protein